jgi:predicted aspartyl protease
MLGEDRKSKIIQRVSELLREVDPEVHLQEVVLDSTRQQLAFMLQKGEWPIVIGMEWLDYVSHRDEELKEILAESLQARLKAARLRQAREGEEA